MIQGKCIQRSTEAKWLPPLEDVQQMWCQEQFRQSLKMISVQILTALDPQVMSQLKGVEKVKVSTEALKQSELLLRRIFNWCRFNHMQEEKEQN